jgi:hypothetical protein
MNKTNWFIHACAVQELPVPYYEQQWRPRNISAVAE